MYHQLVPAQRVPNVSDLRLLDDVREGLAIPTHWLVHLPHLASLTIHSSFAPGLFLRPHHVAQLAALPHLQRLDDAVGDGRFDDAAWDQEPVAGGSSRSTAQFPALTYLSTTSLFLTPLCRSTFPTVGEAFILVSRRDSLIPVPLSVMPSVIKLSINADEGFVYDYSIETVMPQLRKLHCSTAVI
ncbi:hypothetical protein GGF31_001583 [Allomyces arbusculus]|nr:hypothetical protein GGF31_001583 [Allomyces arbusculus]